MSASSEFDPKRLTVSLGNISHFTQLKDMLDLPSSSIATKSRFRKFIFGTHYIKGKHFDSLKNLFVKSAADVNEVMEMVVAFDPSKAHQSLNQLERRIKIFGEALEHDKSLGENDKGNTVENVQRALAVIEEKKRGLEQKKNMALVEITDDWFTEEFWESLPKEVATDASNNQEVPVQLIPDTPVPTPPANIPPPPPFSAAQDDVPLPPGVPPPPPPPPPPMMVPKTPMQLITEKTIVLDKILMRKDTIANTLPVASSSMDMPPAKIEKDAEIKKLMAEVKKIGVKTPAETQAKSDLLERCKSEVLKIMDRRIVDQLQEVDRLRAEHESKSAERKNHFIEQRSIEVEMKGTEYRKFLAPQREIAAIKAQLEKAKERMTQLEAAKNKLNEAFKLQEIVIQNGIEYVKVGKLAIAGEDFPKRVKAIADEMTENVNEMSRMQGQLIQKAAELEGNYPADHRYHAFQERVVFHGGKENSCSFEASEIKKKLVFAERQLVKLKVSKDNFIHNKADESEVFAKEDTGPIKMEADVLKGSLSNLKQVLKPVGQNVSTSDLLAFLTDAV